MPVLFQRPTSDESAGSVPRAGPGGWWWSPKHFFCLTLHSGLTMRLVTYRCTVVDAARIGVVQGDDIIDVQRFAAAVAAMRPSFL